MAENVAVHGDLAQLSGPARCNSCQAGDHRCVFASGDDRCIPCSSTGRECILTRPLLVSAPRSVFSWETLLYKQAATTLQVPSGTTAEQFKETLSPFSPDPPKNTIVKRFSHREIAPNPSPKHTPTHTPIQAAPPPLPPAPAAQPSPAQDDTIRLQQNGMSPAPGPSSTPTNSTPTNPGPFAIFNSNDVQSIPERRPGLRSGLTIDSSLAKGDACDECRKHKRKKCLPSHRRTSSTPTKPSPAQRSPDTQRFACTFSECEKDFTFMGDLQRHTREIHGVDLDGKPVIPHHCPVPECGRNARPFARRDNLRQHLEKRHGMSPEEADNALVKRPRTGRRSTNVS